MKEVIAITDEPLKNFARGKDYFVGYSFSEACVQALTNFAQDRINDKKDVGYDHRLVNAAKNGSLNLEQLKRYVEVRRICGVTLIIKPGKPNLSADIELAPKA